MLRSAQSIPRQCLSSSPSRKSGKLAERGMGGSCEAATTIDGWSSQSHGEGREVKLGLVTFVCPSSEKYGLLESVFVTKFIRLAPRSNSVSASPHGRLGHAHISLSIQAPRVPFQLAMPPTPSLTRGSQITIFGCGFVEGNSRSFLPNDDLRIFNFVASRSISRNCDCQLLRHRAFHHVHLVSLRNYKSQI